MQTTAGQWTTGPVTSRVIWPNGWKSRKWITFVAHRSTFKRTGDARFAERPQTQGKIERWHQTMKSRVLLENYYLPGDLERQIGAFVDYYNNERYHESLQNSNRSDVPFYMTTDSRNGQFPDHSYRSPPEVAPNAS
ncbi:MAG: transposase [Rhodobacteraceae bacterium]|nr:transposase [Paracoccaceae bacterium]